MQHVINRTILTVTTTAAAMAFAGLAMGSPPPGGNGKGKGGGGGKTSLSIEFRCPVVGTNRDCVLPYPDHDPVQGDGTTAYVDGVGGVQAWLNSAGEEIVLNTGKIATGRDVYWKFDGGVELATGDLIVYDTDTSLTPELHATTLVIGRNAGVPIRDLKIADGDMAIDMFANLRVNLTGRKRDETVIFPRFESARIEGGGGERCEPGMGGTDVTIRCVVETDSVCSEWEIEGTDPVGGLDAVACVFAVYPGSTPRGDYTLGPFEIRARSID